MSCIAWDPHDAEDFVQFCVTERGKGATWDKIAKVYKISRTTLYQYFERNPGIRTKIDRDVEVQQIENLRQTGMELAIEKKDRQLLIYLMKAKAKMYDTPQPTEAKQEDTTQAMTPEEARERLRARVQTKP